MNDFESSSEELSRKSFSPLQTSVRDSMSPINLSSSSLSQLTTKSFEVDSKYLDPEYELKKMFGSRLVIPLIL